MHGDFHPGNLFLRENEIIVYDFDACGQGYPVYDIATMCDVSDYFIVSKPQFQKAVSVTRENTKRFLDGYNRYCSVTDIDLAQIPTWIALRHYDIQATILESLGSDCVDAAFLDNQLNWLWCWLDVTIND